MPTMKPFIVTTTNEVTRILALKALRDRMITAKHYTDTDIDYNVVKRLHRKACMRGGKIVITTPEEMKEWRNALAHYSAQNPAEKEIWRVLYSYAAMGYNRRCDNIKNKYGIICN